MDSEHNSICHVLASELYPKRPLEPCESSLPLPFQCISGEYLEAISRVTDGLLALSNYRLYLQLKDAVHNVPLGLVESVQVKDVFYLYLSCKDARSLRCTFATNEDCQDWLRRFERVLSPPKQIECLFAFAFHAWSSEECCEDVLTRLCAREEHSYFRSEVERLRFDVHGAWRITTANAHYKLCPSYPKQLLVPGCVTDETLETAARFRSAKRLPAVVWRHVGNGAVIARCSQPEVGWLGWRSSEDEDLIKAMADACGFDKGRTSVDVEGDDVEDAQGKKVLIMDARSYTTAVANRARGGGCECPEYYPRCEIQFMSLANIHSIRKSFQTLRQLCCLSDSPNWLSLLENSKWLHHMSGLLKAASAVAFAIEREARPVLVHCSDGWDRTPQIVALAQILLDPHYRTIEGFQTLIQKEWLDFGHKFADRCGHSTSSEDVNERCPVFLQWLDCVHQLLLQFPCSFQYSQDYLVKLSQHVYSNLFGTFLCNSAQDRASLRVSERTFSVWRFLKAPHFRNHLYAENNQVLVPSCNVRDMVLWSAYLTQQVPQSEEAGQLTNGGGVVSPPPPAPSLPRVRSCEDLGAGLSEEEEVLDTGRRSSHPSIEKDAVKLESLQLSHSHTEAPKGPPDPPPGPTEPPEPPELIPNGHAPQATPPETNLEGEVNGFSHPLIPANRVQETRCSESEGDEPSSRDDSNQEERTVKMLESEMNERNQKDSKQETATDGIGVTKRIEDCHSVVNGTDEVDGRGGNNGELNGIVMGNGDGRDVIGELRGFVGEGNGFSGEVIGKGFDGEASRKSNGTLGKWEGKGLIVEMKEIVGEVPRGCEVRRKNRTISEELCDNFADQSDINFDICESLEELNGASESASSTETLVNGNGVYQEQQVRRRESPPPRRCSTPPPAPRRVRPLPTDIDGLALSQDEVQSRLRQMMIEQRVKQHALERELHALRQSLIHQACHKCIRHTEEVTSRPESTCSTSSAVCSLPSDLSWEAVDETEARPVLWVPDHAVQRCQSCESEFWLGRRKHHCRNCGKIFCSDCSENTAPLPGETLYEPVRVCNSCHGLLASVMAHYPRATAQDTCKKASSQSPDAKITTTKTATT